MKTNINITNSEHSFKYLLEYIKTDIYMNPIEDEVGLTYNIDGDVINIYNKEYPSYNRIGNEWFGVDSSTETSINQNKYKMSKIRVYFPQHSIETYTSKVDYMLTLNTWVNGKKIYLGNYLFNRLNSLAVEEPVRFEDGIYYEYIEFNIIDPWDLIYSDDWKSFRESTCGEIAGTNNTGSCLGMTLYPIMKSIDDSHYILFDKYDGGQNSFNIYHDDSKTDYLSLSIKENFDEVNGYGIKMDLSFNKEYENNLNLYLTETYGITADSMSYELVAKNNNKIILNPCTIDNPTLLTSHMFSYIDIQKNMNDIQNWAWSEEYYFTGSVTIYFHELSEEYYLGDKSEFDAKELEDNHKYYINENKVYRVNHIDILSNSIPITHEVAKYLTFKSEHKILKINLDDMNINKINVVNEIVNNVIQIDKPEDSKSNIVTPVFFKVRDAANIIIHPEVTENICINLDQYKNKVERFVIQIEGVKFDEIGSTPQGIIFKVIGNRIPAKKDKGTYFILNENYEMITSGKYILDK